MPVRALKSKRGPLPAKPDGDGENQAFDDMDGIATGDLK